jgi:hypothetical protein
MVYVMVYVTSLLNGHPWLWLWLSTTHQMCHC